ncbi:hypothetical protein SAMN05443428_13015 [Caloramator quimbayensis]|uniref:Uncharacterized protein n=1 Tax=Caloramator quimbayensis TaxID=1147123 RepID=A0A1T4Y9U3_9CLOT|nr:hypothetical protein [Caloramator quimbayensis]SKA98604.1 hypothetical protein SAMN05443428_13015 [Caloramator quimbayensis]
MRLFIIGRVFEGDKLVAYKLYDADKKVMGIYPKENVRHRVRQGIHVVGLRVTKDGAVTEVYNSFSVTKTDILNGKGNPIEPSGRYILLGYSGFLEETKYRLVNSNGYERIVSQDEFKELVEEDKVNGAIKSTKIDGKIIIYKHCNYREYNY